MNIHDLFEKHENDYLRFEKVENKKSTRPDLHAFILLNELFPRDRDLICSAAHDEIWLDVDTGEIETLTENQIIELNRCGVRYDEESDSLVMYV